MKIHEYQAKEVLRRFGVKTLEGVVITDAESARKAYETLGTPVVVVKAQIHAGGRGKGGGVKLAKSADEAVQLASEILGMNLVTHQTGPAGKEVQTVYVEQGCNIVNELYLGIAVDRAKQCAVLMGCAEGGIEIETIANESPEKIIKEDIHPVAGLQGYQARRLAVAIGIPPHLINKAASFMVALSNAYIEMDCSLAEINPLVITDKDVLALDAKLNFDDNALFRHKDIVEYRDLTEEEPTETEASDHDLSYIKLDGNIGCMVNGAGLAMSTMDIIKLHGAEPANFLDVGGGATAEQVTAAFKILMSDKSVKGVLVNIFGGIMKCDIIAEGILEAVKTVDITVPLVVRLEGTNVKKGKAMLDDSGLAITTADSLDDAAAKMVAAIQS